MGKFSGILNFSTGSRSISLLTGLSSDELVLHGGLADPIYTGYFQNSLTANGSAISGSEFWRPIYSNIFNCNSAIEGLEITNTLTPIVKAVNGEAKFMRAFFLFLSG